MAPRTLLEMSGAQLQPPGLGKAALVLIDYQNEYLTGALPLVGGREAVQEASRLLEAARSAGGQIIHVVHKGGRGGLFDREDQRGQIVDELAPRRGEVVIEKPMPNAFAKTSLVDVLEGQGRRPLVIAGFMTHMCVSSTVRAALDLDFTSTVVADACATRDLPGIGGNAPVGGETVHRIALTELSDRFALVVQDTAALQAE